MIAKEAADASEERKAAIALLRMLSEFLKIRSDIPASHVRAFLVVALEEGQGVHEYAKDADVPPTTMTRQLLDIGEMTRLRMPGMGLIQQRMDPADRRKHQSFLTNAGKALLHRVGVAFKHSK